MIQKSTKNKISELDSSTFPERKNNVFTDPAILTSNAFPLTLKPLSKPDLHRDDSLTSQSSSENFQFKPQLRSLYMVLSQCKFQINPNRYSNHNSSFASKHLALYE